MNRSFLGASLLSTGLLALAGCGKSGPPPAPPPVVATVTAQPRDVPLTRDLVGRLSAYYSANVTARVSGVLLKRSYAEGSEVKAGQTLFEIDPSYYKTVLDNSLATLAEDQATYVNDRITAERDHQLLPVGSVSQQTVDNADAAERSAAAKVQADRASVESARVNLGYTKVTSPITGIAGEQQVTAGTVVGSGVSDAGASGTLLATVQQIDPLYVNFTLSAADLVTLRQAQGAGHVALAGQAGTAVSVTLPNGSTYGQAGTLDFSDAQVNATTGAVNLRARIPNPQHQLLPGMFVTLKADFGRRNGVFLIPQQAIQRDVVGAYAMVVAGGKAQRRNVEASASYGNDWIVTSGLAAGDEVIVTGLQGAREGATVKAGPWQAPAAAQGAASAPHAGQAS
ncbi:efflux RND transporter periplasmic adaptor subunit [Burkholderia gladioli]|jgi:membrane fusion protein (multidrug efflux system)|uniref:efflux RND transporter periplasmic adaptor subunit n=1 Tax=Burkholderia gladioli TaxID=28095 RepID=UPI000F8027F5|nr:efflux RND transporter periplasmic adaptor subunit [Burkholderia gladioli]MBU9325308.1 efflux RND transporter periplasmic adaptor subunit [Burkholderia gladioli]